jgi:hypothetical protein
MTSRLDQLTQPSSPSPSPDNNVGTPVEIDWSKQPTWFDLVREYNAQAGRLLSAIGLIWAVLVFCLQQEHIRTALPGAISSLFTGSLLGSIRAFLIDSPPRLEVLVALCSLLVVLVNLGYALWALYTVFSPEFPDDGALRADVESLLERKRQGCWIALVCTIVGGPSVLAFWFFASGI